MMLYKDKQKVRCRMPNDLTVVFLTLVGYTTITYLGLKLVFRIIDKIMWRKEDDKKPRKKTE